MKRVLSICLLVVTIIASSSFTTNSAKNPNENSFKHYYVLLTGTQTLPNGCVVTLQVSVSFEWTPANGVSDIQWNAPTFTISCGNYTRTADITTLTFDNQDAHATELVFERIGDANVDDFTSNSHNITALIADMNSQIDGQKP